MKTRLTIFAALLLICPMLGLWLTGGNWDELTQHLLFGNSDASALFIVSFALLFYVFALSKLVLIRTKHSPLKEQNRYFVTLGFASVIVAWLLYYLNFFTASWASHSPQGLLEVLCTTLIFALLVPSVLLTRALLASFPLMLKLFSRLPALPQVNSMAQVLVFSLIALFGLISATLWQQNFFWLTWLAPLSLLFVLQLLWGQHTILFTLTQGNYSRLICSVLAGLLVGNLFFYGYTFSGGQILLQLPHHALLQVAFALFGLLSLQLGDVLAEPHHGKSRDQVFPPKRRPFPIPVVVKKG